MNKFSELSEPNRKQQNIYEYDSCKEPTLSTRHCIETSQENRLGNCKPIRINYNKFADWTVSSLIKSEETNVELYFIMQDRHYVRLTSRTECNIRK